MVLSVYSRGRLIRIACPDSARIVRTYPGLEDCLALGHREEVRYILRHFVICAARRRQHGSG
jgi:hypothetical protein